MYFNQLFVTCFAENTFVTLNSSVIAKINKIKCIKTNKIGD